MEDLGGLMQCVKRFDDDVRISLFYSMEREKLFRMSLIKSALMYFVKYLSIFNCSAGIIPIFMLTYIMEREKGGNNRNMYMEHLLSKVL